MNLDEIRNKIDLIDEELLELFIKRLELVRDIARLKSENNAKILDKNREEKILYNVQAYSGEYSKFTIDLFKQILRVSKEMQKEYK